MWSSWTETAKSSLTQALEKTGDAITRTATEAGKAARVGNETKKEQQQQQQLQPTIVSIPGLTPISSDDGTSSTTTTSSVVATQEEDGTTATSTTATSPSTPRSKKLSGGLLQSRMMNMMKGVSIGNSFSKNDTGSVVTNSSLSSSFGQGTNTTTASTMKDETTSNNTNIMKSFVSGWNTVIETTKASVKNAEIKVKEQQHFLQQQLTKARVAYYKRDPSLPLDIDALKDAEVVYITDRLITMGHPASMYFFFHYDIILCLYNMFFLHVSEYSLTFIIIVTHVSIIVQHKQTKYK
jgi:hypothetical protein